MHFPRRGLGLSCLLDVVRLLLDRLLLVYLLRWLLATRLHLLRRPCGLLLGLRWLLLLGISWNVLTLQRLLGRLLQLLLHRLSLRSGIAPRLGLCRLLEVHVTSILSWLLLHRLLLLLYRLFLLHRLLLSLSWLLLGLRTPSS